MSLPMRLERTSFAKRLSGYMGAVRLPTQPVVEGRLLRMVGLTLEAEGLRDQVILVVGGPRISHELAGHAGLHGPPHDAPTTAT